MQSRTRDADAVGWDRRFVYHLYIVCSFVISLCPFVLFCFFRSLCLSICVFVFVFFFTSFCHALFRSLFLYFVLSFVLSVCRSFVRSFCVWVGASMYLAFFVYISLFRYCVVSAVPSFVRSCCSFFRSFVVYVVLSFVRSVLRFFSFFISFFR